MKKYDYKVEQKIMVATSSEMEDYLKEMNKSGWRFIQVQGLKNTNIFYFEKEITSKIKEK